MKQLVENIKTADKAKVTTYLLLAAAFCAVAALALSVSILWPGDEAF
jgi:hypothetical protein